jgi:hypothetical protein
MQSSFLSTCFTDDRSYLDMQGTWKVLSRAWAQIDPAKRLRRPIIHYIAQFCDGTIVDAQRTLDNNVYAAHVQHQIRIGYLDHVGPTCSRRLSRARVRLRASSL